MEENNDKSIDNNKKFVEKFKNNRSLFIGSAHGYAKKKEKKIELFHAQNTLIISPRS